MSHFITSSWAVMVVFLIVMMSSKLIFSKNVPSQDPWAQDRLHHQRIKQLSRQQPHQQPRQQKQEFPFREFVPKRGNESAKANNYGWAFSMIDHFHLAQNLSISKSDPGVEKKPRGINLIFEVGSRDLKDGNSLADYFNAKVYSFDANPENYPYMEQHNTDSRVTIVKSAVSTIDGNITFYPTNLTLYRNPGASSMFLNDFVTNRYCTLHS